MNAISQNFTITANDFVSAAYNDLVATAYLASGIVVAMTVNQLMLRLFHIKERSFLAYCVKPIAILAGSAVCIYLIPEIPLLYLSQRKIVELFAVEASVFFIFAIFRAKVYLPLSFGALFGYIGNRVLVPLGVFGSVVGAACQA